jgi:hypothetical protein
VSEPLFPDVDITEVRKTLIAESYDLFRLTKAYFETIESPAMSTFEFDVYGAIGAGSTYAYLLAGVLQIIENRHGNDEAREMAALFDAVRDGGTEVLEDVNHDIDERARADGPAPEDVEAKSPACPEIDVTLGAPVQIYYEFPDPLTGRTSGRRVPCTIVKIDGDWFRARPDRLGRGSIGNEFRFRIDTFEADDFNYGWHVEAVDAR